MVESTDQGPNNREGPDPYGVDSMRPPLRPTRRFRHLALDLHPAQIFPSPSWLAPSPASRPRSPSALVNAIGNNRLATVLTRRSDEIAY
jgi:hypothetical protein